MTKRQKYKRINWSYWDTYLGTAPDSELAKQIGCDRSAIAYRRNKLDIPTYHPPKPENKIIECACGCGGRFYKYSPRGRERFYLPSHWSRLQPSTKVNIACENCGKLITRQQWHVKKVQHHFCCRKCHYEWASKTGARRGSNNGHYNTITVPCSGCGQPVSKAKSLIMRRNNHVYCKNCIHLTRKGRPGFYVGYPLEFSPLLRKKIRQRDGQLCQLCKSHKSIAGTLHVHHIDYDKTNNNPMNLISLCSRCHGKTNFGHDFWMHKLQSLMLKRFPTPRH